MSGPVLTNVPQVIGKALKDPNAPINSTLPHMTAWQAAGGIFSAFVVEQELQKRRAAEDQDPYKIEPFTPST
ncbi:MAG: hypothetical protein ABSH41_09745 [Syntrophobacteraceae bacterium]|jgi:hypothetical protein